MPVNIDTVYQKVLAIANKEQRGYITPQEFNLFASQAQMDIFEQYFYDINALSKMSSNDTEYSDVIKLINEKVALFKVRANLTYQTSTGPMGNRFLLPENLYSLGTVIYNSSIEVEPVNANEALTYINTPLAAPTISFPVYFQNNAGVRVFPTSINANISCTYTKRPRPAKWAYVIVPSDIDEKALYDPINSIDFELHSTEETKLVYKILELSGITIKNQDLHLASDKELTQKLMQEKQ